MVIVVALACLCLPASARADGDPASDYLLTQNAYLPYNTQLDRNAAKALKQQPPRRKLGGTRN